jgi:hypothetical protein
VSAENEAHAGLHAIWREAAQKGIEQGIDWPRVVLDLFQDLDTSEAEAHNLAHEVDRVRERLWRLAALAGWQPGNPADNDATAELYVTDALKAGVTPPSRPPLPVVDGLTDLCPAPGYAGRHTAVGAGAISPPYRCHGCGAWFTLANTTATTSDIPPAKKGQADA